MRRMKYIVKTLKYMFKNLWCIILLGLLPAFLYTGAFDFVRYEGFLSEFFTGKLLECTFSDFFCAFSVINVSQWYLAILSVVGFFVSCLFMAVMIALIEKHMRIGKRTLNGIFSKLNDNIVATVVVAFFSGIVYFVWIFAVSLAGVGCVAIFQNSAVAAYIFFVLLLILFTYLMLYTISRILLWLPCQLITGFRMFESLTYAAHLVETKKNPMLLALVLPYVIGNVVLGVCALGGTITLAPVVFFIYLFFFLYLGVLMEVAYFEEAQMEREDLKPAYKRRRV